MKLTVADVFSFVGASLGFSSMILAVDGNFQFAFMMLVFAAIIDFLDGRVARKMNDGNDFGKNIDSICDIVSFGIAPAFLMGFFLSGAMRFLPFLIVVGGIYRLARYNTSREKYYTGMPITMNGIIVPLLFFVSLFNIWILVLLSFLLSALMVSRIKIRKL